MTYLPNIPQQLTAFFYAVGFGFCLGILYDVLRAVRRLFFGATRAFLASDVLFAFCAAFLTFLFALAVHGGSVRGYVLFGEGLGFLVYYFTAGVFVMRVLDAAVRLLRRFFRTVFRWFAAPFKRFSAFCTKKMAKNVEKVQKKSSFSAKKLKTHLQTMRQLLYNHSNRVPSGGGVRPESESDGIDMKTNRKRKKQKHSFILSLALLLAVGYFVISFVSTQLDIREKEQEKAALEAQYAEQVAENERLQAVVDGGDESEYIERVAREKLGYVMPDEKVYYDITPSN